MSNLSTFYKPAVTAADLNLGTTDNVTFASIQNTPIGSTTASTVAATNLSASGTVSGTGFSNYLAAPPAIGNTTPAAGSFTTLTANNGTLTASAPVLDLAQTWNDSGVVFTGAKIDITNTASATGSKFLECLVGGTSEIRLARAGSTPYALFGPQETGVGASSSFLNIICNGAVAFRVDSGGTGTRVRSDAAYAWASTTTITSATDLFLRRDAANTLAQYNGTNPQAYNIYNTFTSATNHERGFLKWSSNVFQIGTEAGSGGGTARSTQLGAGGAFWLTMASSFGDAAQMSGVWFSANSFAFNAPGFGGATRSAIQVGRDASLGWSSTTDVKAATDIKLFRDAAGTLAQRNVGNAQAFRIYNTWTSATDFERINMRWASNEFILDAEAGADGGTLRGIKIGSATSSLLGFYGVTPVDQPATVADPAGGGTVDTEARTAINAIIDRLQELGLVA